MDNSFFIYLEQLELIGFFSGYLFVYLLVKFVATILMQKKIIAFNFTKLLPYSYALVGLLFLGYQLKNLYPNYSIENLNSIPQNVYLKAWALLSILFFIPALAKKPALSLLHSLVFFYFIVQHLFNYFFNAADSATLQNYMSIYTRSLLLHAGTYIIILFIYFTITAAKRKSSR